MPAPEDIRTIPDLQSFLHSYSIKHPGEDGKPFTTRCQTIVNGWKVLETAADADQIAEVKRNMAKAAKQLADLDDALHWLPAWKPRVAVAGRAE